MFEARVQSSQRGYIVSLPNGPSQTVPRQQVEATVKKLFLQRATRQVQAGLANIARQLRAQPNPMQVGGVIRGGPYLTRGQIQQIGRRR